MGMRIEVIGDPLDFGLGQLCPHRMLDETLGDFTTARGGVSEFLPVYKKAIANLAWRPAKHVGDRGYVPFAAPRRLDATLIEHVGN